MPKQPLTKRNHKYYPLDYRREVIEYSALFGHKSPSLVARNFAIPESTVRGWIRDETKAKEWGFWKWTGFSLGFLLLTLLGVFAVGLTVIYAVDGADAARFFINTFVDLGKSIVNFR